MKKLDIKERDLVVVCDGRKALLLENEGDQMFPHLSLVEVIEQSLLPDREYHRHEPGRTHQSGDERRGRIEQIDQHDKAERDFLHRLVNHVEKTLAQTKRKRLFIIAPPRALGMLRKSYTSAIREALKGEVTGDLVSLPIYEIEEMLAT